MHVLFVCTGNSCRSQMCEGFFRSMAGPACEVASAGTEPHGLNPRAVAVMAEAGGDISAPESSMLTDEMLEWADLVVTVCGHADERCPVLPAGTRKIHWPLQDPAMAEGSQEEVLAVFRASRDDIRERVAGLFQELSAR
jgi:arsenate reductase